MKPDLAMLMADLGDIEFCRGNYRESVECFSSILRDLEASGAGMSEVALEIRLSLAQAEWYTHGMNAARTRLREACSLHCDWVEENVAGLSNAEVSNYSQRSLNIDLLLSVGAEEAKGAEDDYRSVLDCTGVIRFLKERRRSILRLAAGTPDGALHMDKGRTLSSLVSYEATAESAAHIDRTAKEKERLERALDSNHGRAAGTMRRKRCEPLQLQERLPQGSALVHIVAYCRDFRAYTVSSKLPLVFPVYTAFILPWKGSLSRVELGNVHVDVIYEAVEAWRTEINRADRVQSSWNGVSSEAAWEVRRLVWEPIRSRLPLGTSTLILFDEGGLAHLPWSALPGDEVGTVLLESYAITHIAHPLSILDGQSGIWEWPRIKQGPALLVGGAPTGMENPLHRDATIEEVGSIRKLLAHGEVLIDRSATCARVQDLLSKSVLAHFAVHGYFIPSSEIFGKLRLRIVGSLKNAEGEEARWGRDFSLPPGMRERVSGFARNPGTLCGLQLAPDGQDGGKFSAEAISALDACCLELVILSACDTSLGEFNRNETEYSLCQSFFEIGAKHIVSAVWEILSLAATKFMISFYRKLESGLEPALALRATQLEILRDGPDGMRTPPAYWAGFRHHGMVGDHV